MATPSTRNTLKYLGVSQRPTRVFAKPQTAGSEALQSYDIVAAVPCCQRSFEVLCKDSDVDVISLPSGKRLPFNVTKKNVGRFPVSRLLSAVSFLTVPSRFERLCWCVGRVAFLGVGRDERAVFASFCTLCQHDKKGRLLRLRNAYRRCVCRFLVLGLIPARIASVFCRLTRRWRGAPSSRSPTARPSRVSPGLSCLPALAGLPTSGFLSCGVFLAFLFSVPWTVPVSGVRGSRRPWRPDRKSVFREMPRSGILWFHQVVIFNCVLTMI